MLGLGCPGPTKGNHSDGPTPYLYRQSDCWCCPKEWFEGFWPIYYTGVFLYDRAPPPPIGCPLLGQWGPSLYWTLSPSGIGQPNFVHWRAKPIILLKIGWYLKERDIKQNFWEFLMWTMRSLGCSHSTPNISASWTPKSWTWGLRGIGYKCSAFMEGGLIYCLLVFWVGRSTSTEMV